MHISFVMLNRQIIQFELKDGEMRLLTHQLKQKEEVPTYLLTDQLTHHGIGTYLVCQISCISESVYFESQCPSSVELLVLSLSFT